MHTLLIILAVVGGLFVLVCAVVYIQHRLHPDGYEASPRQIREELQKIMDGRDVYILDDFISIGPLKDPRLEAIRLRVGKLDEEFPPESKGEYCSPKGIEVIRGYIRELENEAA